MVVPPLVKLPQQRLIAQVPQGRQYLQTPKSRTPNALFLTCLGQNAERCVNPHLHLRVEPDGIVVVTLLEAQHVRRAKLPRAALDVLNSGYVDAGRVAFARSQCLPIANAASRHSSVLPAVQGTEPGGLRTVSLMYILNASR